MLCTTIFRRDAHRWLAFGQDPEKPDNVIDTNQFVICSGDAAMLLDPGGMEIFPAMLGALTQEVAIEDLRYLFLSHQDPDVASALPLWRRVCPSTTQVLLPWLWTGFVSHFDREAALVAVPDEGMEVRLGALTLRLVPAHYLHSSGNLHVHDPEAGVLFSGDVGAALVPAAARRGMFVEDFAGHVQYMEGFHRRWMGSPAARDAWVEMVAKLDVRILAPQHGLLFKGDDVRRFLDWLMRLDIGSGVAAMRAGA